MCQYPQNCLTGEPELAQRTACYALYKTLAPRKLEVTESSEEKTSNGRSSWNNNNRKPGLEGAHEIATKYNAAIVEEFSKDRKWYTLSFGQPGSMLYSLWRKVTVTRPIAEKEKAQQEFYEKAKALDEAMEEGKTEEE
ncbi:hypothetical protein DFH11DRAFT_1744124 [Phellopilus nigrolimitatus]|nr:hypothetical protein DFH11DRAFT_1744124 [Phellopilus nigrolimitatus]